MYEKYLSEDILEKIILIMSDEKNGILDNRETLREMPKKKKD